MARKPYHYEEFAGGKLFLECAMQLDARVEWVVQGRQQDGWYELKFGYASLMKEAIKAGRQFAGKMIKEIIDETDNRVQEFQPDHVNGSRAGG